MLYVLVVEFHIARTPCLKIRNVAVKCSRQTRCIEAVFIFPLAGRYVDDWKKTEARKRSLQQGKALDESNARVDLTCLGF